MNIIIRAGTPTHFRPTNLNLTACGLVGAYSAFDPRDVDCLRCMKTKGYRKAIGKGDSGVGASDLMKPKTLPPGFEHWNPAMRGAYLKGWRAYHEGLELSDCPYRDKRKDNGRITWSRAFLLTWRDGYNDAKKQKAETRGQCGE